MKTDFTRMLKIILSLHDTLDLWDWDITRVYSEIWKNKAVREVIGHELD